MLDRRDPEFWRDLADRKIQRDSEYLAGKIGRPTYLRSLMIYGFTKREAETELSLLELNK